MSAARAQGISEGDYLPPSAPWPDNSVHGVQCTRRGRLPERCSWPLVQLGERHPH
jgi:hypothetical protein